MPREIGQHRAHAGGEVGLPSPDELGRDMPEERHLGPVESSLLGSVTLCVRRVGRRVVEVVQILVGGAQAACCGVPRAVVAVCSSRVRVCCSSMIKIGRRWVVDLMQRAGGSPGGAGDQEVADQAARTPVVYGVGWRRGLAGGQAHAAVRGHACRCECRFGRGRGVTLWV